MLRSLIIIIGAMTLGAALFMGSFAASRRVCQACVAEPPGSLNWLQKEYHLDAAQMTRIEKLHEDYLTQCKAMCRMMTDRKLAVESALDNATNVNSTAARKMSELAACRVHCQSEMLQYFINVSRAMPPDQGRRYLAEMEKTTLGATAETK